MIPTSVIDIGTLFDDLLSANVGSHPLTVRELFNRYAPVVRGRLKAWPTLEGRFVHVLTEFGERDATKITKLDVDTYVSKRREALTHNGHHLVSPATRNREVAALKALLNWAVDAELISSHKLGRVRLEAENNIRQWAPRQADVEKIAAHLDAETAAIVWALFTSGARRMEILDLRKSELDMMTGAITLAGTRTKTGKPRRIYLGPNALEAIRALPEQPGPFVFSRLHWRTRYSKYQAACTKAGINSAPDPKPTFHHLRHGFVAAARRAGVPDTVTQSFTGHSATNGAAFKRYGSRVGDDEITNALAKLHGTSQVDTTVGGGK
jgi:integrase